MLTVAYIQLDCNLFTFNMQEAEGRKRLERDGHYHLGEVVTKFLPWKPSIQDTHETRAVFNAEHIYFTSSGQIGVILHVDDETALDLTALQRNMAGVITGPGDVDHARFVVSRSYMPKTHDFLDGVRHQMHEVVVMLSSRLGSSMEIS
jgi:hypothetical protein